MEGMMKKLLALTTLSFLFSCSPHSEVNFIEGNLGQALNLALTQNKMVLIDMYSDN